MNPLEPIDIAVAWALTQIHAGLGFMFGPSSGLAWAGSIVILVVLMRLVLVPLFVKQLHATRKMSALAPQIQELKKRYKNDKQKLNEETMKLYKENGANPLAGCLPLVAQFPLFFALFDVLRGIAEWSGHGAVYGMPASVVATAQKAYIFGATVSDRFLTNLFPPKLDNIPHSSQIVIFIFVAVSAATTFMTVRQSTKRGMNPQMTPDNPMAGMQKYMAYVAPVFALSGLYWQFGLVVYWVTTNLWTLGQQYFLFKRYPMPAPGQGAAGAQGVVVGTAPTVVAGKRGAPSPGVNGARNRGKSVGGAGRTAGGAATGAPGKGAPPKPGAAEAAPSKAPAGSGPSKAAPPKARPSNAAPPKAAPPKAGPSKAAPPKAGPSKGGAAKPGGKPPGKPAGGSSKPGGTAGANGSGGSGVLRRLSRRPEPEPEPAEPEVKLVRQQRVRQSRSKRSGKR